MQVISFLGPASYSSTTYVLGDQEYTTRFFPAAVARLTRPDLLLICATPTVQDHPNLRDLQTELDALGIAHRILPIPEGHSESDLWNIFDTLTGAVAANETVTFDVTHSFRSLPFLAFLAVAYLQAAKRVNVQRVLYGAYEARGESNRSPVFDLTPFVSLLNWIAGTERFIETGDGQALADLLRAGMPPGIQMRDDLTARALGRQLKSAADAIASVSLALRVTRPIETMQAAAQLTTTLNQALPGIQQGAKPFTVLAQRVTQEYGQFAVKHPTEPASWRENLRQQLRMIDWYLNRELVVQAATLAREWVISVIAFKLRVPLFDYDQGRKPVEDALNNAVEKHRSEPRPIKPSRLDAVFEQSPFATPATKLWSSLTGLRNDIAHVGMKFKTQPESASHLKQKTLAIYADLVNFAEQTLEAASSSEIQNDA
jgi:CRISPR-associated DxTHG motif protein